MKISFDEFRSKPPSIGWVAWEIDYWTRMLRLCRWWAYPFMLIFIAFRSCRVELYHWLNRVGIMKTPIGNHMVISDIWKREKKR
ncbi:hypothetical protein [Paenibacillus wynnii]|uniref:Uncharacterized protein n=1 Tax=Paenibacillus wynnii TaxID=268407 RepID=A0A098MF02_9BACL|nr:hypothetical protein [Paenibacillus wynnii]KGE20618.1 hypothetical protein PWYN_15670 [Paenibacillus wynnii]